MKNLNLDGNLSGNQPYLKDRASLNSLLLSEKPYFSNGNMVNQLDEPLS